MRRALRYLAIALGVLVWLLVFLAMNGAFRQYGIDRNCESPIWRDERCMAERGE